MINGLSAVTDAPPAYPPASLAIPEFNAPTDCTRGGLIVRSRWEIVSILRPKINFLLLPIRYLKLSFIIVFLHVLNLNLVHIRLSQSWFTIRGSITSLKRDTPVSRGLNLFRSELNRNCRKEARKVGRGKAIDLAESWKQTVSLL